MANKRVRYPAENHTLSYTRPVWEQMQDMSKAHGISVSELTKNGVMFLRAKIEEENIKCIGCDNFISSLHGTEKCDCGEAD